MPDAKALLLVTMEPPAGLEEEFNDWYDTEHFPQRRALPGFLSASRWVCLKGWPKYLALYDLDRLQALETPDYQAVSGVKGTPWSKRILPRTIGRSRIPAEQLGNALTLPSTETGMLLLTHYPVASDDFEAGFNSLEFKPAGLRQSRIFRGQAGGFWCITEFDRPVSYEHLLSTFAQIAGVGARIFNLYCPYHRG
jgi:hypothetical protein